MTESVFERDELVQHAARLRIELPKNLGDLLYSFRYRADLPESVAKPAPHGTQWTIQPAGQSKYRFAAVKGPIKIIPNDTYSYVKVPDATPGIISKYTLNDEQALLARLRYNRLIDIFTRVTCYSLQNHLRTFVPLMGQVETDDIYVGVDRSGTQYVFPVQAKGGRDQTNIIQVEQDIMLCREKISDADLGRFRNSIDLRASDD